MCYVANIRASRMTRHATLSLVGGEAGWCSGWVVVVHSQQMASALKAFSYVSCKVAQKSEHFAFIIMYYAFEMT